MNSRYGYELRCPGVGEYGRGLTGLDPAARERVGLRVPRVDLEVISA